MLDWYYLHEIINIFNVSDDGNFNGTTCIKVYYENQVVGDYYADIIVTDLIILEIKAAEGLRDENKAQMINYLKATNKQVGLLFNFGKKPDFKRAIFSNERKEISEVETSNPCESAQSAASAFYSSG
jgi:hypothetical protein